MNVNQIINMIVRQIMRRLINKGINAGINQASKMGRGGQQSQPKEMTPRDKIRAERRAARAAQTPPNG